MEANGHQTDASFEYTPSNCVGIVEFRDGDLTLLWTNIGFKQFGIFVGDERKQRSSTNQRMVLR